MGSEGNEISSFPLCDRGLCVSCSRKATVAVSQFLGEVPKLYFMALFWFFTALYQGVLTEGGSWTKDQKASVGITPFLPLPPLWQHDLVDEVDDGGGRLLGVQLSKQVADVLGRAARLLGHETEHSESEREGKGMWEYVLVSMRGSSGKAGNQTDPFSRSDLNSFLTDLKGRRAAFY